MVTFDIDIVVKKTKQNKTKQKQKQANKWPNRQWFIVVWSRIDNDIRPHSKLHFRPVSLPLEDQR